MTELEEPFCQEHNKHYSDCPCIGPTQFGIKYVSVNGIFFAVPEGQKEPTKKIWANQTPSGQNKLGPSKDRWKERSKTFAGIAAAMAEQWGGFNALS